MEKTCQKTDAKRLEKLGLKRCAKNFEETKKFVQKCAIAYERYRFVRQEKIDAFNEKLKKKTQKKGSYTFDKLVCRNLEEVTEIPPESALLELEKAQNLNVFDRFEVARIESVEERPDPILFGRIDKCPDRFYIAQWDNDVKIEDLISDKEG